MPEFLQAYVSVIVGGLAGVLFGAALAVAGTARGLDRAEQFARAMQRQRDEALLRLARELGAQSCEHDHFGRIANRARAGLADDTPLVRSRFIALRTQADQEAR